jgi:SAM-dependent methyltransferase
MLENTDCSGMSFVELGCGTALVSRCLFDVLPVKSAVALDFSPRALEKARANCSDRAIRVAQADVLSWDTGERFDLAVSIGLVEHFQGAGLTRVLARHADLLKPGGHALVFMPRLGPLWPALWLFNRLQRIREAPPSDSRLLREMESVGLRPEKVRRFGAGVLLGVLARRE